MATKKKMLQAAAGQAGGAGPDIDEVFSTYLYDGTGSAQTITNGIDLNGEGGLVWAKSRTTGHSPQIYDTARGATYYMETTSTNGSVAEANGLTSFNSSGFSMGNDAPLNASGEDFASWTFRKAPKFFTCLTYTGTGPASAANEQQVSHDLGAKPGIVMIKRTDATGDWWVFTDVIDGSNDYAYLNQTAAFGATGNNVATDSVFNVGGVLNTSGATYVAYLFANNNGDGEFGPDGDQDIIKCGAWTGSGSSGTQVDLGFEPQWVMVKQASGSSSSGWQIFDVMRGMDVEVNTRLLANETGAESSYTSGNVPVAPNATGFKVNNSYNYDSGNTFIYMAIRRGPLAPPAAGTDVFAPVIGSGVQSPGFPVDFLIGLNDRTSTQSYNPFVKTRLLGGVSYLTTSSAAVEASGTDVGFDTMDGLTYSWPNSNAVAWYWKRAPGYFDVSTYTGNSTAGRTVSHNLGVAPEMMWVKCRSHSGENWAVYHSALGASKFLELNEASAFTSGTTRFAGVAPTSSVFSVGQDNSVNGSGKTYIAYLFATLPGISKVGSYTGTGATLNIDCGFTSGARFVLLKRTDSTGEWPVFDTERGIVAGNDPLINLNSTNPEEAFDDLIDPYSAGFSLTSSPMVNTSGGSYIFYAIA